MSTNPTKQPLPPMSPPLAALDSPLGGPAQPPPMQIAPEDNFTRVWHTNCAKWAEKLKSEPRPPGPLSYPVRRPTSAVMRRRLNRLEIDDGSVLWLWECLECGGRVYAGLDAQRCVVTRPGPATVPPQPSEPWWIKECSVEATNAEIAWWKRIDEYTKSLSWRDTTPEEIRLIVAGNIRSFAGWALRHPDLFDYSRPGKDSIVHDSTPLSGAALITNERTRQVAKGWTPEHDEREHADGVLARVAARLASFNPLSKMPDDLPDWGLQLSEKLSGNRIRELVVAGALIAAEIDRLHRQEVRT